MQLQSCGSCLGSCNPPLYQLLAVVAVNHAILAEWPGVAVVVVCITQVFSCCCKMLLPFSVDQIYFEHFSLPIALLHLHHSTPSAKAPQCTAGRKPVLI